jgi:hypothetical protein
MAGRSQAGPIIMETASHCKPFLLDYCGIKSNHFRGRKRLKFIRIRPMIRCNDRPDEAAEKEAPACKARLAGFVSGQDVR